MKKRFTGMLCCNKNELSSSKQFAKMLEPLFDDIFRVLPKTRVKGEQHPASDGDERKHRPPVRRDPPRL